MRKILRFMMIVLFISLLAGGFFWIVLDRPLRINQEKKIELVISNGQTISQIAKKLENNGLVWSAAYLQARFKLLDKMQQLPPLQKGRFLLENSLRPSEVISAITSVDRIIREYKTLVIPPGSTVSKIAQRAEEAGLSNASEIQEAVKMLAERYPIVQIPQGLQGYLFPDTYKFDSSHSSEETARIIVKTMADRFFEILDSIAPAWRDLPREVLHERIIISSIVEREYRRDFEAPKIAAVFYNRLAKGIPLESCATVVYVIEETKQGRQFLNDYYRFQRRIFEKYLEIPSEYNTYIIPGNPPAPIATSSSVSLDATFNPADIDSLFFVVKDPAEGTHTFSSTYQKHLNARKIYLSRYVPKVY